MPKEDETIKAILSLEEKIDNMGVVTGWLGIALFLIGVIAAITGASGWSYAIMLMGITMAIIGAYIKYYFGLKKD